LNSGNISASLEDPKNLWKWRNIYTNFW